MKARLLKASMLKKLLAQVDGNLDRYRSGNFDFLKIDTSCFIETKHDIDEATLSAMHCSANDHREIENCMAIYDAMGSLTHYLARDERLWCYIVHTELLEYARQRWPIPRDDEKAVQHIRSHFFVVGGARGFERNNAASRLWWMASLCSRAKGLTVKEALTALLFQYDVRANIIERPTTSQNIAVFSIVLNKLYESYKTDKRLFERERFRRIMRELNLKGGTKLLEAVSENDLETLIDDCIAKANKAPKKTKQKNVIQRGKDFLKGVAKRKA